MTSEAGNIKTALEAARRKSQNGGEYWMGRDLQMILGYARWESFYEVIGRARAACRGSDVDVGDHFLDTTKVIEAGKGARLERGDVYLSRYGCYLVAMNGDTDKVEVATAQTYFAVQTRRAEIEDAKSGLQKRIEARARVKLATKGVNAAAQAAGVQNFAFFQGAGIRGLYSMALSEVKARKGLTERDELFDRAGHAELAMNDFRLTQTEQKLRRDNVVGERAAMNIHHSVGKKIRDTIAEIGGTMPEDLSAEQSLKKLTKPAAPKCLPKPAI